jgi:hypothetical protein
MCKDDIYGFHLQVEGVVVNTIGRNLVQRLLKRPSNPFLDQRRFPKRFCMEFADLAAMAAQHRVAIGKYL